MTLNGPQHTIEYVLTHAQDTVDFLDAQAWRIRSLEEKLAETRLLWALEKQRPWWKRLFNG